MWRAAVILVCALLLPAVAWGNGIDLINQFGTVIITNGGVVSTGSELVGFNGIAAPPKHDLGSVSFSTGAFSGASIWTGGSFSSAGSSFLVKGVGNYGQPKGVIFNGAFVGPVSWTVVSHPGKWDYVFALSGTIQGQLWDGRDVKGTTTQTIYAEQNQWFHDHQGGIHLGNSNLAVPEPGTLGLFGAGLLLLGGTIRRKLLG